jgi:plastocyanin
MKPGFNGPTSRKPLRRRIGALIAGASLLGVLGAAGPSQAAKVPGLIVAGPGAFVPFVTYLTPRVVMSKGAIATFRNLDVTLHDVVSDKGYFTSPKIGLAQSTAIPTTAALAPGTYKFHCSLHNWMKGQLIVRKT